MKTTARNVFKGKVQSVQTGAVNSEVVLSLPGGESLVAIVTKGSVESLGLKGGTEAIALVKAPWVILMTDADDVRLSARNCFKGKVRSVKDGAVNSEVIVELKGGTPLSAIVTCESVNELELKEGKDVTAVIKASHVILGVPV